MSGKMSTKDTVIKFHINSVFNIIKTCIITYYLVSKTTK